MSSDKYVFCWLEGGPDAPHPERYWVEPPDLTIEDDVPWARDEDEKRFQGTLVEILDFARRTWPSLPSNQILDKICFLQGVSDD